MEDRCDRFVWNLLKKLRTAACITQKDLACLQCGAAAGSFTEEREVKAGVQLQVLLSQAPRWWHPSPLTAGVKEGNFEPLNLSVPTLWKLDTWRVWLLLWIPWKRKERLLESLNTSQMPMWASSPTLPLERNTQTVVRTQWGPKYSFLLLNQILVVYFIFIQNIFPLEQNKIICYVNYIKVVTFILMAFYYYY